jgi:superfamily II DNA or RNA helicase
MTSAPAWRVGTRVRARQRRWRIEAVERGEDCTALRVVVVEGEAQRRQLTLLTPFDRLTSIVPSPSVAVVRPRRWLHEVDRALASAHPYGGLARVATASVRVLPYQLEPALAIVRHGAPRVLIADGVGLGKTIEAGIVIGELVAVSDSTRALVLTPAGLRHQWQQELDSHFHLASTVADSDWLRHAVADRPPDVNPWAGPGIYVASHDLIKRPEVLRALEDVGWDLVVVDESHAASSGTDRRAAIDRVACSAQRVILLTATPPLGDVHEWAALCAIGRATTDAPPPVLFARSAHDVGDALPRRSRVLAVAPTAAEVTMHRELERYSTRVWREAAARGDDRGRLASVVLRKRALSSAASLLVSVRRRSDLLRGAVDPHLPTQLTLPLGDEDPLHDADPDEVLSAPGLDNVAREIRWLATIAEMARAAARAESKVRRLMRLLARLSEPVIVFTEYRDTLARLERQIIASGRTVAVLHGGMDPTTRAAVPEALRNGTQTLLATDAAAEGLNLHHRCRIVVHFELPWSPGRLEQRAGRVDRIGQRARVHEIALVSSTAAERLVLAPLARRAAHLRHAAGPAQMLTTLSESRVAEAVMSGEPLALERDHGEWRDTETRHLDLRGEATVEAERVEALRHLAKRSPHRRALEGNPTEVWLTRIESPTREPSLILLIAVEIETEAGDRAHAEHVLVRVRRDTVPTGRTSAALRRYVADVMRDPQVQRLLDSYARTALSRVSELATARGTRMSHRCDAIERGWASAAQRIVQLRMLAPTRHTVTHRAVPTPASDPSLTVRWRLAGAMLREGGVGR